MRCKILISAAAAAAAGYLAAQRGRAPAQTPAETHPPVPDELAMAAAESAAVLVDWAPETVDAPSVEPVPVAAEPEPEPVAAEPEPEPVAAEPEPEPVAAEPELLAEGRFWIGGVALATGHPAVAGVSFPAPLDPAPAAEQVEIEVDTAQNVPERGLLLVGDPGFAPDREGFTLMLAAGAPGAFSAAGRYRVIAP